MNFREYSKNLPNFGTLSASQNCKLYDIFLTRRHLRNATLLFWEGKLHLFPKQSLWTVQPQRTPSPRLTNFLRNYTTSLSVPQIKRTQSKRWRKAFISNGLVKLRQVKISENTVMMTTTKCCSFLSLIYACLCDATSEININAYDAPLTDVSGQTCTLRPPIVSCHYLRLSHTP